jgi:hypothetical protein
VAPKIVYGTDRKVPVVNGRLSIEHAVHTQVPVGDPLPRAAGLLEDVDEVAALIVSI